MEVISIERSTYEELLTSFNSFVAQMKAMASRSAVPMNELIMPHNVGVKNVLDSMKELLALYKKVTGNYRPMLDGERYLTDKEVSEILKVSRRTLQEYRNDGIMPYILLGGKVLYRERDLEELLEKCYHPAYGITDK